MEKTFLDIIAAWPSLAELSRDVGEKQSTVQQWKNRESIPPEHWRNVETAARARGIEWITIYALTRAAELRYSAERKAQRRDQLASETSVNA